MKAWECKLTKFTAAGEPEKERGILATGFCLNEVVEQLGAVLLVHLHVPLILAEADIRSNGVDDQEIAEPNG